MAQQSLAEQVEPLVAAQFLTSSGLTRYRRNGLSQLKQDESLVPSVPIPFVKRKENSALTFGSLGFW